MAEVKNHPVEDAGEQMEVRRRKLAEIKTPDKQFILTISSRRTRLLASPLNSAASRTKN
jgi:hypothetical protein